MTEPPPSPLMGISRLQLAVSICILLIAILGPFAALLIQINSLSERQAQTNMRLEKIETHNAETEKRFDAMAEAHGRLQTQVVQIRTQICDKDHTLCENR